MVRSIWQCRSFSLRCYELLNKSWLTNEELWRACKRLQVALWTLSWLSYFDCRVWDCLITPDKWSSPFCFSFVPVKGWTSKRWFNLCWWIDTVEVLKIKYDLDEKRYPSMSSLSMCVCVSYICHRLLSVSRQNLSIFGGGFMSRKNAYGMLFIFSLAFNLKCYF